MPSDKPEPDSPQPAAGHRTQAEAWRLLIDELTHLNAQLEYIKLMLKMGVGKF